jgi:hypothetical protein
VLKEPISRNFGIAPQARHYVGSSCEKGFGHEAGI